MRARALQTRTTLLKGKAMPRTPHRRGILSLPWLPPTWYAKLEQLRKIHDMSQWQAFIWSLACTCEFGQGFPERVAGLAQEIKEKFPAPKWAPPPPPYGPPPPPTDDGA